MPPPPAPEDVVIPRCPLCQNLATLDLTGFGTRESTLGQYTCLRCHYRWIAPRTTGSTPDPPYAVLKPDRRRTPRC